MRINCQNDLRQANSLFWGRIFGLSIQSGRKKKAYSVEEAARLAGMEASAWLAVEAGRVPESAEQLRSMASALDFSNA
jgi:transcriptional regulator with XRE-family HTH domain